MENQSSKIIIIILTILVVGLTGFIVYDKILSNNETVEKDDNVNDEENDNSDELTGMDLINALEAKFKYVYEYYDLAMPMCGERDNNDYINPNDDNGYYASKTYTSYNQMIEKLKNYMSEEVIYGKTSIKKENYIEQNGKLYCADWGKGGNIYQPQNITFEVNSQNNNTITAKIKVELGTEYDSTYSETIYNQVKFEKKNDNWIITSYEKLD